MARRAGCSEPHALAWLISQAARERYEVGGVEVRRGQALVSVREMAEVFGWTKDRVHRWLVRLERDGVCARRAATHGTVLTISNCESIFAGVAGYATPCERLDEIDALRARAFSAVGITPDPVTVAERAMIRGWRRLMPDEAIHEAAVEALAHLCEHAGPPASLVEIAPWIEARAREVA